VGRVSVYYYHGSWWVYYRDAGKPVRRKIGQTEQDAQQVAAQVNAQLTSPCPRTRSSLTGTIAIWSNSASSAHDRFLGSDPVEKRASRLARHKRLRTVEPDAGIKVQNDNGEAGVNQCAGRLATTLLVLRTRSSSCDPSPASERKP
jgi:hypothetical protein